MYPLLKATPSPKFAVISSLGGSIAVGTTVPGFDVLPYGTSKAAVNWVSRKIHYENESFGASAAVPLDLASRSIVAASSLIHNSPGLGRH